MFVADTSQEIQLPTVISRTRRNAARQIGVKPGAKKSVVVRC